MQETENVDGKSVTVTRKVFTLANIVSMSRILVALPIIWVYLWHDGISWVFTVLVAYGILSDYLDGWLARRNNEISELGKVIDPIADKVLAAVLFIFAAWLGKIPLWFLIVALLRDGLIMLGSVYISLTRGKVAMSVMSGKVFVNALALYWLAVFYLPGQEGLILFLLSGTSILMIYSFADYFQRFLRILRGAEFN